jgi:gluconolactonase
MCRIITALAFVSLAFGQTARPFHVLKLDPGLDEIVSADAKLETLGEHFGLTEGPVWVQDGSGYLLFSDCAANVIYKWAPNAPFSVFLEKSGYTGTDVSNVGDQTVAGRLAILLIGSNGLSLDAQGRLIITAMTDRSVVRLEKDGSRTVLADRYQGKRFGGPNDLAVKSDGSIYFTDSVFGMRGGAKSPARELPYNGVYRIKDGTVTLLFSDEANPSDFPNGIVFSPDENIST